MSMEFHLPDLGEGITEAQIIKVLVSEGDTIDEDQSLFEVETDKAAVEIPSPHAGVVEKVHVTDGQTVNVGDLMISFAGAASAAPSETAAKADRKQAARARSTSDNGGGTATAVAAPPKQEVPTSRKTTAPAAPAVRKLAREMGVDIDAIHGSGPGGRVIKGDVESATSGSSAKSDGRQTAARHPVTAPKPQAPPPGVLGADKWGAVRKAPLSQIRKTIAQQMIRSVSTIPHVTHIDQMDVTDLEAIRKQYKDAFDGQRRVTAMAFVMRALSVALKNHPVFNASLDMEAGEIIYKDYINIGIAVDTERGLVVPNIRNTDTLSVSGIAEALSKIAENARNVQFAIEDLRGGTFTVTNVGALGGLFSTPIINYPEVAILGLGESKPTPVVRNGEIVVRTILPVSLSFDHRIADGAQAARFCGELIGYLENPVTFLV